ncbi:MAG: hypothetical protein JSV83_24740 [Desulfobacterales bacterium]|nr:MAG: hypothetical protein JSV83_24740 [Desulfobacterales bacterium]
MFNDFRIRQFYDPNQLSGKAIAKTLGYDGRVAWDIYLFYATGSKWVRQPPTPNYWVHQIRDDWASRSHFHTGDDLVKELYNTATKMTAYSEVLS